MQKLDKIIEEYKSVYSPELIIDDILEGPYRCNSVVLICKGNMLAWVYRIKQWDACTGNITVFVPSYTERKWFKYIEELGFLFAFKKGLVDFGDDSYPKPLAIGIKGFNFVDNIF